MRFQGGLRAGGLRAGGLAFVFAKFRALQLVAGNTHGPDNSGATHNLR